MALLYVIKDWNKLYENNRTRELVNMTWIPIPNKMDGDGYTELVSHENGAAHFGAWIAILEIASKCEPRGTLLRENGEPHTPASLSRMSRLPHGVFAELLTRLTGKQIGWMEVQQLQTDSEIPQDDAVIPQDTDYARARALPFPSLCSKESKNGKSRSTVTLVDEALEDTASRLHERHCRRKCALKVVRDKLRTITRAVPIGSRISLLGEIDKSHEAWCASEEWTKEGGAYQKGLQVWLNPQSHWWEVLPDLPADKPARGPDPHLKWGEL